MIVRFTRRAIGQIHEISETIALDDARSSDQFAERVDRVADLAARHPAIGRPTDLHDIRVIPLRPFRYLLFYKPFADGSGIMVLRVRHMARNEDWRAGR